MWWLQLFVRCVRMARCTQQLIISPFGLLFLATAASSAVTALMLKLLSA